MTTLEQATRDIESELIPYLAEINRVQGELLRTQYALCQMSGEYDFGNNAQQVEVFLRECRRLLDVFDIRIADLFATIDQLKAYMNGCWS